MSLPAVSLHHPLRQPHERRLQKPLAKRNARLPSSIQELDEPFFGDPCLADERPQGSLGDFTMIGHSQSPLGSHAAG
jgi:hypothetical protein